MQLNKFSLVTLILLARPNRAETVVGTPRSNSSTSTLFEDLVDIVTSCYGDQINGVGLAGNLPDTFIRTLSVEHSIPVALMGNARNFIDRGLPDVPVQFRHKLHVFIVEASNYHELDRLITMNIKYFIWWNHMASFFIVDRTPGCINNLGFLYLASKRNILNAKVICRPGSKETVIFTCNPFTSQAPVVWRQMLVAPLPGRMRNKNRPFTMFVREYRGNKAICENLDFDKSKDLGSQEIFIDGYFEVKFIRHVLHNLKDTYKLAMTHMSILSTVLHVLKGTPKATNESSHRGLNGDMRLHPTWMNDKIWDQEVITYPHARVGFVLISQFRGHKSQLGKILTVIDYNSRIGMGIVYLITLIFFKFFVHQNLVPAILNLVRITCNTGFANLSDNNASRFFLTGLLFFVVTMQGIYQGNLASLLTTIIPLRDIETMQDVVDFGYKIYGSPGTIIVVDHPELRERFITVKSDRKCHMHVVNDSSAACLLIASGITVDRVREFGLHMSSEFIVQSYVGFQIEWDRPFEQRVNTIIQQLVEADVLEPWNIKCAPTELSEFQFDQEVKGNKVFKKIELGELTFAFVILGIGLVCATVTYVAEVAIYSYKSRVVNVRVHKLN